MSPPRALHALALLALVLALTAAPVLAQEQEEGEPADSLTIHDADEGAHPTVSLTVEPPSALLGAELSAEDFTVIEDGEPREVSLGEQERTDLEVILTIDTSTSMGEQGRMPALLEAADQFITQMPPGTPVGVVRYANAPEVVTPPSDDHEAVREALAGLSPGGRTALYDAVPASLETLADAEAEQTIVLFADGEDNNSGISREDAVAALEDTDVTMHVVEFATEGSQPEALEALSQAGGGLLTGTDDTAELAALYDSVASALLQRYELVYDSQSGGQTDVVVAVDAGEVSAEERVTLSLPDPAPEEPEEDEEDAAVAAPALSSRVLEAPLLATGAWLWVGGGLVGLAIAVAVALLLLPTDEVRVRLGDRAAALAAGGAAAGERGGRLAGAAERASQVADRALGTRTLRRTIALELERAGIDLRPGEFVVVAVGAALGAAAVGVLLGGPLLAVVLLIAGILAPRAVLRVLAERRRRAFADQLPDVLQLLSGSLRAGYGLTQAVDSVARDADAPASEEFRRIVVETRLGRDFGDTLDAAVVRLGNEDFAWVVQAIKINREVGGDLSEILDNVGETIRERGRLRRQVKALSAEGKLSAAVLYVLPFAVVGFVSLTNPGYLAVMLEEPVGWAMLAVAAVLLVVGGVWLKRMVRLQY